MPDTQTDTLGLGLLHLCYLCEVLSLPPGATLETGPIGTMPPKLCKEFGSAPRAQTPPLPGLVERQELLPLHQEHNQAGPSKKHGLNTLRAENMEADTGLLQAWLPPGSAMSPGLSSYFL